ncbi:MAG: hypothetical protein R6U44_02570 [Archaeoglobaceae archaeon]
MDKYLNHLLKDVLSTSEYDALLSKMRNESYSHKDFNKAMRKLRAMGFSI